MGMDFRDEVGKWVLEANMFKSEVGSELRELGGTPLPKLPSTGHLTGCAGADPHNSLTSASFAHSGHFPHKTGKMPNISDKAAAFHPHKQKSQRD